MEYQQFLKSKVRLATRKGFDVELSEINPLLKPHQAATVRWALSLGCAGLFLKYGLGKTIIQCEILRLVLIKVGGGRGLITAPLGVRQEFQADADTLRTGNNPRITDKQRKELKAWLKEDPERMMPEIRFVRQSSEVDAHGIYLTNYESVREGKLDPNLFAVASLDEADCLRAFGGSKTFREFMALFAGDRKTMDERTFTDGVKYRFVATATPDPNEYIELLAYSAFLGVMEVSQAKTRFFKRDSTKADKLTLHPHKEKEFWLWVSSWALFLDKPSDLGFTDEGYELPELDIRFHEVKVDHLTAIPDKFGQGRLYRESIGGVVEASKEKRDSLDDRIAKVVEIVAESPDDHFILWHDLEDERRALEKAFAERESERIEERSAHKNSPAVEAYANASEKDALKAGLLPKGTMVRHRSGVGRVISWTGNLDGYFLTGGYHVASCKLKDVVEHWTDDEGDYENLVSVYGSQDLDRREQHVIDFRNGKFKYLAGKPQMLGSGPNFQYHCHRAIYAGVGYKFKDFIQSIHRLFRFLQTEAVRVDIIYAESERSVLENLLEKWKRHDEQTAIMSAIIKEYGLSESAMRAELTRKTGVERTEIKGRDYKVVNNDCIEETRLMESDSVGMILTSIPFSTQYEYSPNYSDLGHTDNNEHFFEHMDYLTSELFRVLQPGRVAAIHVKDRIVPGGLTGLGFQTVYPFSDEVVTHFRKHGFGFMARKTIVTDVVRENNQTYRLGWSEQCKDGTKMGAGMPEYLLLFRKPQTDNSKAYADIPVTKSKDNYSRSKWQVDAHGFARSEGDRLLTPEEIKHLSHTTIFRLFRKHSLSNVYDFKNHVELSEALETCTTCDHIHTGAKGACTCGCTGNGRLPTSFMLLQPQSWSDEVWSDITRMRTLNANQYSMGKQMHLCPLQFDICDRAITQLSNEGDLVYDPFGGLGTVGYCALNLGRRGYIVELSEDYFLDAAAYLEAAEQKSSVPRLFDLVEVEENDESLEVAL